MMAVRACRWAGSPGASHVTDARVGQQTHAAVVIGQGHTQRGVCRIIGRQPQGQNGRRCPADRPHGVPGEPLQGTLRVLPRHDLGELRGVLLLRDKVFVEFHQEGTPFPRIAHAYGLRVPAAAGKWSRFRGIFHNFYCNSCPSDHQGLSTHRGLGTAGSTWVDFPLQDGRYIPQ